MRWSPLLLAALVSVGFVGASREPSGAAVEPDLRFSDLVPERYARWLEEVGPIVAGSELAAFLQLREDYQRDAFIDRFWRVRDPYPETARNEMRERYEERVAYVRANYETFQDDRARVLLVHGEPARTIDVRCTTTRSPASIWVYGRSEEVDFGFVVVFVRNRNGTGPARIWRPDSGRLDLVVRAARSCINGVVLEQVVEQVLAAGADYSVRLDRVLMKPRPRSLEWVDAFRAESTDIPAAAEEFAAQLGIGYLGRYQNRVVVEGVLRIERSALELADLAGHRSHDVLLLGEIVDENGLFERFRYKFGFAGEDEGELTLLFQRYLRPGIYELRLLAEDLNGNRFHRVVERLEVPVLEQAFVPPSAMNEETAALFREATAALAGDAPLVRLLPPAASLQTGFVRFDTLATGPIDHVVFSLNGQAVLTRNRPPFSVELDLGPFPRLHRVEAAAFDAEDVFLASDTVEVNAGDDRFSIRLVEHYRDTRHQGTVLARAVVRVPEGATLDRVELWVNDTLSTTLYQEPFRQPLELPSSAALSFVRAVAYLVDGDRTEHYVYVNAPAHLEEVDIEVVELYTAVTDRDGRPVPALELDSFEVFEDGVRQSLQRFERVEDLPIHVGVVIDNSASMRSALDTTRAAALEFFQQAIRQQDRAALITFNRFPHLAVKLTNDLRLLGGGLAGLTAEGQTALYDSLMFALYYFSGISGQRAVLLLSDGKDEVSEFSFPQTLEYARRAGVTIYSVGLGIPDGLGRRRLAELADETGGRSYFIRSADELAGVYDAIERELRAQYLLAYQSTNTAGGEAFRGVEVKVALPGAQVKTMSGYYP